MQQIPFSQWRVPKWNSKQTYVRNAATRDSHSLQSHNYQHSTQPKFKVQVNSSCPKSTIAYYAEEWHDTKSTMHLRFVNYVKALNYSATGGVVVVLYQAWLCAAGYCLLLVATYGNSMTSVDHPPHTPHTNLSIKMANQKLLWNFYKPTK